MVFLIGLSPPPAIRDYLEPAGDFQKGGKSNKDYAEIF